MPEIATINGISPSAISTINGVSISAIDTINGCTPGGISPGITTVYATIDSFYIDTDLTNFPVGIQLDSSHGILYGLTATDWQGIHATVSGAECYVEVDIWDMTNDIAVLWVRCPTVSSSANTTIIISYEGDDNTAYIGEIGDTAGQAVWDSNFVGVWHMSQDPSGGAGSILDSTTYANHGTPQGSMTSGDVVDASIGRALALDGTDDYISVPHNAAYNLTTDITAEILFAYADKTSGSIPRLLCKDVYGDSYAPLDILYSTDLSSLYAYYSNDSGSFASLPTVDPTNGEWGVISTTYNGATAISYSNGGAITTTSVVDTMSTNTDPLLIGSYGTTYYTQGSIGEVRLSNIARSAAWVKATAQNLLGDLVSISDVVPESGIFLTIDSDYIDADLINMPVGVVLDSSIAMLAGLSSTDWRYLHATSGGYELFVEVDVWDMTVPLAVLWIRCPSLLSSSDTVVKLEITSELNDFFVVASARNWDTFNGTDGDPPNFGLWRYIETGTDFTIQSNALQADHTAIQTVSLKSWAALSGDFDIQIDFDILTGPSTATWAFQFIVTPTDALSNNQALIDRRYDGTNKFFSNIKVSGGDDQSSSTSSVTSGKLRIIRSGSNLGVWYYDTDWWNPNSVANFTTADVYIMLRSVTATAMTFSAAFDNLIINSCDSITGFIGETGDDAAQVVWDSDFVGVWHMSQDPSGGTDSILDSTVNAHHGTPQGTMTSDDLIDGGFGKALELDGANDFIDVLDSSDLDLDATKSMTMEGYVNSYIASVSDIILDKRDTNYGYLLGFHSSNSLHCYTKDGTDSVEPSGSTTLTRDGSAYYHSAGIFDRSTDIAKVFLNGTQDSSDVDMSAIDDCSNASDLRIGHTTPTSSWGYFYGAISEARISDIVRSAAWIKTTAQNLLGNLVTISEVQPTIKYATIDSTLIDSDLTNFPIGIQITATDGLVNGLGATDYEGFHFTIGGVECYAEVDVWEPDNGSAVIWVRCPTVTSSADTVIKIQNVGDDNTAYVGVTGSTPAQTVWDSNFMGVWHMSQDPSGGTDSILDSTANANHGTPQGTMTSDDLVDGGFGKAIEFDGTNGVVVTSSESLKISTNAAVELYYKDRGTTTSYATQLFKRQSYLWTARSASALNAISNIYLSGAWRGIANYTISQDTWLYGAFTYNSTSELLAEYINGTLNQSAVQTGLGAIAQTDYSLSIGFDNLNSWYSISSHSEIRISNIDRSAAWIKATAQNLLGNLVTIS